jgi:antirestriction protein ArdC
MYRGANIYLSFVAQAEGYKHNKWITFNQVVSSLGLTREGFGKFSRFVDKDGKKFEGKLVEGKDGAKAKAYPVEFWKINYKLKETGKYFTSKAYKEAINSGKHEKNEFRSWWTARTYYVFNIEQTAIPLPKVVKVKKARKTQAENLFKTLVEGMPNAPKVSIDGRDACYSPPKHTIHMPTMAQFKAKTKGKDGEYSWFDTSCHELVHSSGHKDGLSREGITDLGRWGDHKYAKEELIAESGASMIAHFYGLVSPDTIKNTKAYLQSWSKVLKKDPTIMYDALRESSKAVTYILQLDK